MKHKSCRNATIIHVVTRPPLQAEARHTRPFAARRCAANSCVHRGLRRGESIGGPFWPSLYRKNVTKILQIRADQMRHPHSFLGSAVWRPGKGRRNRPKWMTPLSGTNTGISCFDADRNCAPQLEAHSGLQAKDSVNQSPVAAY